VDSPACDGRALARLGIVASDSDIAKTVQDLLREVASARSDLLKADEVRRMAAADFRKLVEVNGRPVTESAEKLDRAMKD
jgi:hypothetical protein